MIHLLFGDDELSRGEVLEAMKQSIQPAELRDVNVVVLEGRDVGYGELAATCFTVPFMSDKRMVVVRGLLSMFESRPRSGGRAAASSSAEMKPWDQLPDLLAEMPPTTDLVFVDGPLRPSNPVLKKVQGLVEVKAFPVPRGRALGQWVQERAGRYRASIDYDAAGALADAIGNNLRIIDLELQKLSLYRGEGPIRRSDVQELVAYVREANVFAAVDAVLEGRPGTAISSMHQLMDSGSPASYVIIMIARQVRLLLLAKDLGSQRVPASELGRRLGLSGYPLRKTIEQERRFTVERLAEMHRRLLEADRSVKRGEADEALLLEMLIADLTLGGTAPSL